MDFNIITQKQIDHIRNLVIKSLGCNIESFKETFGRWELTIQVPEDKEYLNIEPLTDLFDLSYIDMKNKQISFSQDTFPLRMSLEAKAHNYGYNWD